MKKIFLIIIITALGCAPGFAQTYDSLAAFTNKTEFEATDIMAFQTKVSNAYTWRKITGANFWAQLADTTSLGDYVTIANAETITGKKIYSNSLHGVKHLFPTTTDTYMNGWSTVRWLLMMAKDMYAESFHLLDPAGSDSSDAAIFTYDGTNITADKPLNIASGITLDSASTFNVFNYEPHSYTVPSIGDTILTLTTSDGYSLIEIDLPGNVNSPGISKIQVDEATKGMILKIYNGDADYQIKLVKIVSGDDNLYLSADFSMDTYDSIELLCVDASKGSQKWIESVDRSNN